MDLRGVLQVGLRDDKVRYQSGVLVFRKQNIGHFSEDLGTPRVASISGRVADFPRRRPLGNKILEWRTAEGNRRVHELVKLLLVRW
ncbi:hypothetical protein D3C80_1717000 [compost metagenome]